MIDIVLVHPLDFGISYKHKVVKKAADVEIFLASVEDIIKMNKRKIKAGRDLRIAGPGQLPLNC